MFELISALMRRISGKEKPPCKSTGASHVASGTETQTFYSPGSTSKQQTSAAKRQGTAMPPSPAQKSRSFVDSVDSDVASDTSSEDEKTVSDPTGWKGGRPRGQLKPPIVGRPSTSGNNGPRPGGHR